MINPEMKLAENLFEKPGMASTREGFGKGSVEAGQADPRVVVLTADLSESTQAHQFQKAFPERFVQVGVAEQNLATVASGMANYGKIPFFTSYAMFSPGRNWEQIRTTIALNNISAKVCGMHAGVSVGPDGATHQALEDIALMRVLPHMTVVYPCDAEQGRKATLAAATQDGPFYLRFGREKTPVMTTADTPFELGKAEVFWKSDSPAAAIFSTGPLTHNALLAARELEQSGIAVSVVNFHTIKPLDRETLIAEAKKAGAVVTVEEHQIAGGFGGAVAEVLAQECPLPIEFVGVHDLFGQSGTAAELIEHYGMGVSHIVAAVKKVIARK
ncbi:MAG TPA: transketolase C-terminal domain-containing protein [Candidatus Paceibacterota bacterium]|nr:transketolase C-terminal domain-containing protein [Candidatus Paceibacterota bacterium]